MAVAHGGGGERKGNRRGWWGKRKEKRRDDRRREGLRSHKRMDEHVRIFGKKTGTVGKE